jgi:asparagine synthase (glutamine-hydrolysing)
MPGIFGLVMTAPQANLSADLSEMADRLKHHPWYKEDHFVDAANGLALGRVSLGFIDAAPQPARNEDGSLLAVMAGEVFDYSEQRRALTAAGHVFHGESHAELLLHGYEQSGRKFFDSLGAAFVAAIWDVKRRRLILVNDRFGMKSLYYARLPGRLLFASEIKALLTDPELSRRANPRGIAQFFTYGQLLGEDTLLEDVQLLPAAGLLTYDSRDERLDLERYWRLGVDGTRRGTVTSSGTELLDAIDADFKRAVDRNVQGTQHLGLSLSGGLDARTILGVTDPGLQLTTVTLGMEGSIDLQSAAEMARLTNRPHHSYLLNTRFLATYEQHMRQMVHLTDGQYLCQCIVMPTLPLYRELGIEVLLRGHAGELMHMDKAYNFSLDAEALDLGNAAELESWLFRHLRAYMLEGIGETLFAPPYRGQLDALARESLRECLMESEGIDPPVHRIWHLFVSQRLRRETALSMVEFGSVVETRLPYLDADLVATLLGTPPELKMGEQIQSHILRRRMPSFLDVVNANTGARMGAGRVNRAFNKLRHKVLAKLGVKGYQPYERLGLWLREELRTLVERLLLSDRCLGRGVFDADAVKAVVDAHLNLGRNHTYLLLAMMIFELGQREFIDGDKHAANGCHGKAGGVGSMLGAEPVLLESD